MKYGFRIVTFFPTNLTYHFGKSDITTSEVATYKDQVNR